MVKHIRVILAVVVLIMWIANIVFILANWNIISQNQDDKRPYFFTERFRHVEGTLPPNSKIEDSPAYDEKRETLPGDLDIQVHSSKEKSLVLVNGNVVSNHSDVVVRGIIVVVLNQETGDVMADRSFDTYASKVECKEIIEFINALNEGRIICMAIKDEATLSLNTDARSNLQRLGSSFINSLKFRDMWAFVIQRIDFKNQVYAENHQPSPKAEVWAKAAVIRTSVRREPDSINRCIWKDDDNNQRRKEFCRKYEGYHKVCSCNDPLSIAFYPPLLADGSRVDLPVIVMAGNRPQYLFRMLNTLRGVQGLMPSMVTVFIDGFFDEPASVARMFGLRVEQHEGVSSRNSRICQHYKRSLTASFDRYPDANFVVILEEDLDISVDILSYFKQLLPVLENDESVYCISAWNDQGYKYTVNDPSMMYRVETMPGLGWVLSRKLYKDELEAKWPKPDVFWDWDMWMRQADQKKGRECIVPDISRTFHFGAKGLNMNPAMHESYFSYHAFNTQPDVKLNADVMYKDKYEEEISRLFSQAEILDHLKTPCTNPKDFVPDTTNKIYLFYIRMDRANDWTTWINVARCFRLWDLDVRGFHKSMWRLWVKRNHVLIVGCPASPYCTHKPGDLQPIFMPNKETRPSDENFFAKFDEV